MWGADMRLHPPWLVIVWDVAVQVCKDSFNSYQAIVKRTLQESAQANALAAVGATPKPEGPCTGHCLSIDVQGCC